MLTPRSLLALLVLGNLLLTAVSPSAPHRVSHKTSIGKPLFQKGMSYATYPTKPNFSPDAYSSPDSDESLRRLAEINTEWVAINVVWYQPNASSSHIYANATKTPTNDSVTHAIDTIHRLGMKVMLKPMIDLEDGRWRGEIRPSDGWFKSYAAFIGFFAELAQEHEVELFCIGCELEQTASWRQQWETIISEVRKRYSGPITYADILDGYKNVEWWGALDYVGINAYFPLTDRNNPTLEELKSAWNRHVDELELWQSTVSKPIIFTEIGYRSGDGANKEPWKWWGDMPVDLQEQADCYEAAFQMLWNKSWFYGFYWWHWQTNPNAGGSNDSSYTPQNKPAQGIITHWYSLSREANEAKLGLPTLHVALGAVVATTTALLVLYVWRLRKRMEHMRAVTREYQV